MTQNRQIVLETPGLRSGFYVKALQATGTLTKSIDFRGLWHAAKYLGRLIDPKLSCTVAIGPESKFTFLCGDPYWARLVASGFVYEAEIGRVLELLRSIPFSFLDCGANFGYWSILFTQPGSSCRAALAVEASPTTFQHLSRNRELNDNRFDILNRALYARSGETVLIEHLSAADHAGTRVGTSGAPVETITFDDLADKVVSGDELLVVKLDVEGMEIEALKGASRSLSRAAVIMYEDHGSDRESGVTRFVLEDLGLKVFFWIEGKGFVAVDDLAAACALKTKSNKGYNFFAVTPGAEPYFSGRSAIATRLA